MPSPLVLCATDLSDLSMRAADLAALCARALSAPLLLVHVADLGPADDELSVPTSMQAAAAALRARVKQRVERAAKHLEDERARVAASYADVTARLAEGRPWEAIVEAASTHGATLVVVAPHGPRRPDEVVVDGLRGRLLGSTADRVVRYAPCPVLVASAVHAAPVTLEGSRWLAPVDFSDTCLVALAEARAWARRVGGTFCVMHVLPRRDVESMNEEEARSLGELYQHEEIDATARVRALLTPGAEAAATSIAIRRGDPAREIASVAHAERCELVVMGTHARKGLAHLMLGSVTERVLRCAEQHVLCVHERDAGRA